MQRVPSGEGICDHWLQEGTCTYQREMSPGSSCWGLPPEEMWKDAGTGGRQREGGSGLRGGPFEGLNSKRLLPQGQAPAADTPPPEGCSQFYMELPPLHGRVWKACFRAQPHAHTHNAHKLGDAQEGVDTLPFAQGRVILWEKRSKNSTAEKKDAT